jgi:multidrug resistance efflux pump
MKSGLANWTSEPTIQTGATARLDVDSFAALWVAELFSILPNPACGVLLIRGEDGVLKLRGALPAKGSVSEQMKNAASRLAEKGRPVLSALSAEKYVVGAAVRLDGIAAVAVAEISTADGEAAQQALRVMTTAMGKVEAWLVQQIPAQDTAGVPQSAAALGLMARALEGRSYRDAAQRAATELAQILGAERVAVTRKARRRAKVEGLSHAADVKRRSETTDFLATAADEALDQALPLSWPNAAPNTEGATKASLAALASHSGAAGVAVVPFGDAARPWGALVAEFAFAEDAPTAVQTLDIAGAALAPLLDMKRREDRWLPRRVWDGLVDGLSYLLGPAALGWKLLALALIGVGVFLGTYKSTIRVTSDAVLQSEQRVLISAPFDGFLTDRLALAGDQVTAGQVLLTLDERDLTLEKLRLEATRSQKEIERDAAVSERDRGRLSVLSAEISEISARLDLNAAQLEAGRMRAPFDGFVALDQTTGKIGAPVGRGEELMQIAPLQDLSIRLFVPDAEIDRVQVGQSGQLRLAAFPDTPQDFQVTRVTPLTEAREGVNSFVATAQLRGDTLPDLTLGMEGVAKIDVDHDLWVKGWAVPLIEKLRLRLWSWWP